MTFFFARTSRALLPLAVAVALIAAACASSTNQVATSAAATDEMAEHEIATDEMAEHEMATDEMAEHSHGHGEGQEVSVDLPTPSLSVEAFEDPAGGWTVHAVPANHRIAPEHASTPHRDGEGHMHLYVDGERIGRIYNEWVPLPSLGEGAHDIRVELSANNHAPLTVDGETIDATVTVQEGAPSEHGHHGGDDVVEATGNPGVTIEVFEDPKVGWNVRAVASDHVLAPRSVSSAPVDGEGHMHLYVDGVKVTRMYGEWVHVGAFTDGEHELRVELSANNHKPLAVNGEIVDATVIVTQVDGLDPAAEKTDQAHGATIADNQLMIMVSGGEASGDTGRVKVDLGTTVEIVVDGDANEEVHVHGYDILANVTADENAVLQFTADIPGLFEVELEGSGALLTELEVR